MEVLTDAQKTELEKLIADDKMEAARRRLERVNHQARREVIDELNHQTLLELYRSSAVNPL